LEKEAKEGKLCPSMTVVVEEKRNGLASRLRLQAKTLVEEAKISFRQLIRLLLQEPFRLLD